MHIGGGRQGEEVKVTRNQCLDVSPTWTVKPPRTVVAREDERAKI